MLCDGLFGRDGKKLIGQWADVIKHHLISDSFAGIIEMLWKFCNEQWKKLFPDLTSKSKEKSLVSLISHNLKAELQQPRKSRDTLRKRIIRNDSFSYLISCRASLFCHKLIENFLHETKQWSNERALKMVLETLELVTSNSLIQVLPSSSHNVRSELCASLQSSRFYAIQNARAQVII